MQNLSKNIHTHTQWNKKGRFRGRKETSKNIDAATILTAGGKCEQSTMTIMYVEDIFRMTSFK